MNRVAFALLAALSFGPSAFAETAEHVAVGTEQAEERFRQGTKAFEAGRYSEAYAALRAAWDLAPGYKNAAVLGQVELHLSQYRDAAEHLAYCLRNFPDGADPVAKKHVEAGLAEAREHIGALRLRVDPEGAAVLVDAVQVGRAPLDGLVFVEPGTHRIEVTADGWVSAGESVDTPVKVTRDVSISLEKEAPPPAVAPAVPDHSAPPASREEARPPAGGAGLSNTAWALIVGGALTAAATGTAVVFALNGSSASKDVDRLHALVAPEGSCAGAASASPLCAELAARADDRNRDNRIATIAAVTAGVLGAATVATAVVLESTRESPRAGARRLHFGAAVVPGGGFVALGGRL